MKNQPVRQSFIQENIFLIIACAAIVVIFGLIALKKFNYLFAQPIENSFQAIADSPVIAGETEISGQVFVVTKGGENYKMGLVTVLFVKEKATGGALPVGEVKTDADGKFTLKLPKGNYLVYALAQRTIYKETEHYSWKVPIALTKDKEQLFLSNDNLDLTHKPNKDEQE